MWTFVYRRRLWDEIQATTSMRKECLEDMQMSGAVGLPRKLANGWPKKGYSALREEARECLEI